eukprot:jgi/Mesvir1/5659/Mv15677-RA.1
MADCGVVRAKALSVEGADGALWRFRVKDHALRVENQIDEQWYLAYTYHGDMAAPYMGLEGGTWEFQQHVEVHGDLIVRSLLKLPYTNRAQYDGADPSQIVPKAYADLFPSWAGTEILAGLTDVNAAGVQNGMGLVYDAGTSKWVSNNVTERGEFRSSAFAADVTHANVVAQDLVKAHVGGFSSSASNAPVHAFHPDTDVNVTAVWIAVHKFPAPASPAASFGQVEVEVCDVAAEPAAYGGEVTRVVTTGPLDMLTNGVWDAATASWTLVASIELPGAQKIDLAKDKAYRVNVRVTTTGAPAGDTARVTVVLAGTKTDFASDVSAPVSTPAPFVASVTESMFAVQHGYDDSDSNNLVVVSEAYKGLKTGVTGASLMAKSVSPEGFVSRKLDSSQGNSGSRNGTMTFDSLQEGKPYDVYLAAKDSAGNVSSVIHATVHTSGGDLYGIPYDAVKAFWDFEGSRPFDRVGGVEMRMSTFQPGVQLANFDDFQIYDNAIRYGVQTGADEGFRAALTSLGFPVDSDMTIVMDVYLPSSIATSAGITQTTLFRYGSISGSRHVALSISTAGGVLYMTVDGRSGNVNRSTATVRLAAWNRVCVVRKRDLWSWYFNGRQVTSGDLNEGSDPYVVGTSEIPVAFADDATFFLATYGPSNARCLTGVRHTNIAVLSMAADSATVQRMRTPLTFASEQTEKSFFSPSSSVTTLMTPVTGH